MKETYIKFLIKYLNKKINLEEFDKEVDTSDLDFIIIDEEEIDDYQILSKPYLKFFYIRSNIHLNRLTNEELNYLEKIKDMEYNEEIEKFIESTYQKLIKEKTIGDERSLITYGAPSKNYLAYNDSLVIGFRFDEYNNDQDLDDKTWRLGYFNKLEKIDEISKEIKQLGLERLGIDVTVIRYNEFTVTKKNKI